MSKAAIRFVLEAERLSFTPFDDETLHEKIERFCEQNYLWMVRLQELAKETTDERKTLE